MDGGRRELPRLGRMSALRRDFRAWLETHRARLSPDDTLFAQWPCLSGERGEILVDFVARFERLHEDWDVICRHIGVEVSLPHRHKTCHLHYSAYYDRETADLVRSLCERDVDLFRYSFEGLSPVDAALDWSRFARDCALAALPSGTRLKALRRRLGRGAGRS